VTVSDTATETCGERAAFGNCQRVDN